MAPIKNEKNYMTPAGAEKLRLELQELIQVERPKVVETVSWAAGNGDRSENGDYIYGKKRLRQIDSRIRFLTKRLDAAHVVDPKAQNSDRVLFGATVTVENEEGIRKVFQIVGADEAEAQHGRISWKAPVARALLQAKVGDVVTVKTPRGEEEYEVLEIRYI